MSVAYLMEQNSSISKEGSRLLVKKDGKLIHTFHTFKLSQVVVLGNVFLTPSAIRHLLHNEIDTVFMTLKGKYLGRLQPLTSKNIVLRKEQFRRGDDTSFIIHTSKAIVRGKLTNLRSVLMRINRERCAEQLSDHILKIRNLIEKLEEAQDIDAVRGYEGKGSALYFDGFPYGILPEEFVFKKRIRRPPTDPVNALLSLGYTLLFNTVLSATYMAGFDPYLGFLHTVDYGRPSLALDLMEEWRPVIIDSIILSAINLRVLTTEDFVVDNVQADFEEDDSFDSEKLDNGGEELRPAEIKTPVKLTDAGFRKFIIQFERRMAQTIHYPIKDQNLSYRDCIREQVYHFARYLRGEDSEYLPIALK